MTAPVFELARHHIPLLKRHFDQLSAEDLRLRFGTPRHAEAVHAYVENIPFERDRLFGVFADDLGLAGVAHLACLDSAAELGLSVLPQERGRGIGTALFHRALTRARNLQLTELFMHCLTENGAMLHIVRKAGMALVLEQPEADAYLEVPPGNALTLGHELLEQQIALFDWALKAQVESWRRLAGAAWRPALIAPERGPRRPELRLIRGGARMRQRRYG